MITYFWCHCQDEYNWKFENDWKIGTKVIEIDRKEISEDERIIRPMQREERWRRVWKSKGIFRVKMTGTSTIEEKILMISGQLNIIWCGFLQ